MLAIDPLPPRAGSGVEPRCLPRTFSPGEHDEGAESSSGRGFHRRGDGIAVPCHDGRPFDACSGCQDLHIGFVDADHSGVSSLDVVLIGARVGAEEELSFVGTQPDVLAHEITGGKEEGRRQGGLAGGGGGHG